MTISEELKMPKVTLYVKDADAPTWERAKALTGDTEESLSGVVSELLKGYVDGQESRRTAEERIRKSMQEFEFELSGPLNNNVRRVAKFTGANLASGAGYESYGSQNQYTLFITSGGSLVVHAANAQGSTVEVFRRFDDFKFVLENKEDGDYRLAFGNVLPDIAQLFGEDFTLWIE